MSCTNITIVQLFHKPRNEIRLDALTLLKVASLVWITFLVMRQLLYTLVDSDIKQIFEGGLEDTQGHLRLEVRVDQVPQIFHVRQLVGKLAVHEADEKQLLWLMQAILEAELVVAQQCLLVIVFVAENILLVLDVDIVFDHTHMIWPQLHCVAN